MSSTYSTNLRTELIGSGDQAGTWGNTTNTSLGSILEQAIAGVSGGPYISGTYPAVNFPTDADITLTANNGSVDQSRSMVLVITSSGSLTATRNVIAPASASKVYIIKNSTSGGQSIQIKYSTGTGVTIANGVTAIVYGDGTNFNIAVNVNSITGNLAVSGNATIGGTLGVTGAQTNSSTISATTITATTQFSGPGTGLTGTAPSLSIGGTSAGLTGTPNISVGTIASSTQALTYNSGAYNLTNIKQGIQLNQTFTTVGTITTNYSSIGVWSGTSFVINTNNNSSPTQNFVFDTSGNFTAPISVSAPTLTSTVATGTAPFTVTSTTPVTNLSIGGNAATATTSTNATNVVTGGTIASNVTATTQSAGTSNTTVATTAFATTAIQALYPVGSIYTSTVSTNPNTLFGFGTWVAFGAGQVMIGNGSGFTAGSTGGSADAIVVSHTHTATSTVTDPGHQHGGLYSPQHANNPGPYVGWYGCDAVAPTTTASATTGITVATTNASTGTSGTNANLPPYIVVYMWNRTA